MTLLYIFLSLELLVSVIAFLAYYADKKKAKNGLYRTPEKTLLLLGLFFGAPGAIAAMKKFRHKTKHWYFWAVNILGLIIQIAIFTYIIYILVF